MNAVTQEIADHVQDPSTPFGIYHSGAKVDVMPSLSCFLRSSMDEVRLRYAAECSRKTLAIIDMDDADYFRRGLLRREVSGMIDYAHQRDHSAHTLYNYLLGWYVYAFSERIREALKKHFVFRGWTGGPKDFGDLWPFASLTHDVGYLFEGALSPLTVGGKHTHMQMALDVVRDYFTHDLWAACGFHSVCERNRLLELSGTSPPQFLGESLTAVADGLRGIGDLDSLRDAVVEERKSKGLAARGSDHLAAEEGLPGDAFDVWRKHYEYYGFPLMGQRITRLERAFEFMLSEGLGATGLRLLDHGICSGLLMLQMSTYYFRVHFGLGSSGPDPAYDRDIWQRFRDRYNGSAGQYECLWWWSAILWGTAATALHNAQQLDASWPDDIGETEQLPIDEDPLAYLGILVDCLQEWDRYTVSREPVIGGSMPLQGVDVELGHDSTHVEIDYHDERVAQSVKHGLDLALADWEHVVSIL
ncbi:MAG TPA: hypothetical protein VM238_10300 [Phycisphaerae bacterium]|nr:hypothetical protein [Phycisphaerae bacterium]